MICLKNGRTTKKYNPRIRTFALTLHFYSPRGYRYLRSIFRNGLPSVSTIRKWYSAINGKPGFSTEAFAALKLKAMEANSNGEELLVCILFDEMAIRKQEEFDEHTYGKYGQVNFGTSDEESVYAKESLVYMVTGVNISFKIPVAYFLISGIKAEEKAALTQEVILLVNKTGSRVVGLTFDGLVSNLAMIRIMGAAIYKDRPYIINPHSHDKIFIFPDACHMLKLARNRLAIQGKIYDGKGNCIEWKYLVGLEKYQRENQINIGNKINKTHIQWEKKKMSVRIACETLSNSVADSLDLLRIKGVMGFEGSQATSEYLRRINNVFDILNSMYESATHFKRPTTRENKDEYFKYFEETIEYMHELKLSPTGKGILKTKAKTPFLGFTICMKNFQSFYMEYVETNILPRR